MSKEGRKGIRGQTHNGSDALENGCFDRDDDDEDKNDNKSARNAFDRSSKRWMEIMALKLKKRCQQN